MGVLFINVSFRTFFLNLHHLHVTSTSPPVKIASVEQICSFSAALLSYTDTKCT